MADVINLFEETLLWKPTKLKKERDLKGVVKIGTNVTKKDFMPKLTEANSWICKLELLALSLHSQASDIDMSATNYMKAKGKALFSTWKDTALFK